MHGFLCLVKLLRNSLVYTLRSLSYMGDDMISNIDWCSWYIYDQIFSVIIYLTNTFVFFLTDYTPDNSWNTNWLKYINNIKNMKEKFSCPNKIWNVNDAFQSYRQYMKTFFRTDQIQHAFLSESSNYLGLIWLLKIFSFSN